MNIKFQVNCLPSGLYGTLGTCVEEPIGIAVVGTLTVDGVVFASIIIGFEVPKVVDSTRDVMVGAAEVGEVIAEIETVVGSTGDAAVVLTFCGMTEVA